MKIIVITSPVPVKDEALLCNLLFAHGLELLHLRKPNCDRSVYENFINRIAPGYRNRIVIHDHYDLVSRYKLHGIHLKSGQGEKFNLYPDCAVSISCHTTEEINTLPFQPDYCFLSPIFDSISKPGYNSTFSLLPDISDIEIPVIALGGITPEKTALCRSAGFQGIAALGFIWEQPEEAIVRFIQLKTPFVMSIAGFDPSSGAGITADLKTFEATGSYGLGVCSALTFQNEDNYGGTHWTHPEEIQKQCEFQFRKHLPEYLKIGLIENFEVMDRLTDWLINNHPGMKIIWDPVLKASAGYTFHTIQKHLHSSILKHIYLLTPNTDEVWQLFGKDSTPRSLQEYCRKFQLNILWKGGHNAGTEVSDYLITPEDIHCFSLLRSKQEKHGTGCIFSAALTSALAQGISLIDSCNKAQLYVSQAIESNNSKLSFHYLQQRLFQAKPSPSELRLQYITAPKTGLSLCEQIESVCQGGMRWIQLRMKNASDTEMMQEGKLAKEICRRYNALFIINDNVQIARQLDADGIHLGKEDMNPLEARKILGPGKIIGATCNTWEDIVLRYEQQVDYIGLGPFAFTTTKEKLSPVLGLDGYHILLRKMKKNHISIPVFAIGGIQENDIPDLAATGIQGIAVSGLLKNSEAIPDKTEEILHLIYKSFNHKP